MVNLLSKLRVASRLQALVFALKHGVVRVEVGLPLPPLPVHPSQVTRCQGHNAGAARQTARRVSSGLNGTSD
jgi:hypothetical protein